MKAVLMILVILFSIILFLMLDILFYHPKLKKGSAVLPENDTEQMPVLSMDPYHEAAEEQEDTMRLLWKDVHQLMEKTELDHVLLYRYHSASNEKPILFVSEDERNRTALLNAAAQLNQDMVITRSFILAIPLSKRFREQAMAELEQWVKEQHISLSCILFEGSDNEDLNGDGTLYPLVSHGLSGEICVHPSGVHEEEWMNHVPSNLFPIYMSASGREAISSLNQQLPWQLRTEMHLKKLQKKAARDFLILYPRSISLFEVQCTKENNSLILHGNDMQSLQEAASILQADADQYGVQLNFQTIRKPSESKKGSGYHEISIAAQHAFGTTTVPFILPYTHQLSSSLPYEQIWYMPYNEGKKTSAHKAVLFYEKLLSTKTE